LTAEVARCTNPRDAPRAGVETGARALYDRAFFGWPGSPRACRGDPFAQKSGRVRGLHHQRKSQMPKLKTKSGAKKRFKLSSSGKVIAAQTRKRHGMIKRTKKQIRQLRGTRAVSEADSRAVRKYYLPYG
jgi:large subunit ribosomal protein L35